MFTYLTNLVKRKPTIPIANRNIRIPKETKPELADLILGIQSQSKSVNKRCKCTQASVILFIHSHENSRNQLAILDPSVFSKYLTMKKTRTNCYHGIKKLNQKSGTMDFRHLNHSDRRKIKIKPKIRTSREIRQPLTSTLRNDYESTRRNVLPRTSTPIRIL